MPHTPTPTRPEPEAGPGSAIALAFIACTVWGLLLGLTLGWLLFAH